MADPTSLDSALYRTKAYAKLLLDDPEKHDLGLDLALLCRWIETAKPFLGDISIDPRGSSFSELRAAARRHGGSAEVEIVEPTEQERRDLLKPPAP